jgi:hypothetical protein
MAFRHSKIVCTIGPASRSARIIERLMGAGMDVARLNFSHGSHADHAQSIALIRAAAITPKPVAILLICRARKIRTGPLQAARRCFAIRSSIITTAKVLGDPRACPPPSARFERSVSRRSYPAPMASSSFVSNRFAARSDLRSHQRRRRQHKGSICPAFAGACRR